MLELKKVIINFPFKLHYTEPELIEWLHYELGISAEISISNPLFKIEWKDCIIRYSELKIS